MIEDETKVKLDKKCDEEETEDFEEDQEVHTKEAWKVPKKKKSYMTILMVIGEITNMNDAEAYFLLFHRKESVASVSAFDLQHLLWNCCKLLF